MDQFMPKIKVEGPKPHLLRKHGRSTTTSSVTSHLTPVVLYTSFSDNLGNCTGTSVSVSGISFRGGRKRRNRILLGIKAKKMAFNYFIQSHFYNQSYYETLHGPTVVDVLKCKLLGGDGTESTTGATSTAAGKPTHFNFIYL
ncbi:hypothetical protein GQ457_05G001250 [Hibiscus cannabinus]